MSLLKYEASGYYGSIMDSIASQFDSTVPYSKDEYVAYKKKLWRFTSNHAAGDWSGSDVELVDLVPILNDLITAIGNKGVVVPEGTKLDHLASLINSILPSGYTRFDYIEYVVDVTGVGNRIFSLPMNVDSNEDLEIIITFKENFAGAASSVDSLIFTSGIGVGNTSSDMSITLKAKGIIYSTRNFGEFTWPNASVPASFTTSKSTIKMKNGVIYNGEDDSVIYSNSKIYAKHSLTGYYIMPFDMWTNTRLGSRRYEVKLVKNDVVLYDYVPVRRDNDGAIGFYDLINHTFTKQPESSFNNYVVGND